MSTEHSYGTFEYGDDTKPEAMLDLERAGIRNETTFPSGEIAMRPLADQADDDSVTSEHSHESTQAGVKRLEAISSTWSKSGLSVAYVGIALLAFATSLEAQTTTNLTIFATSAFASHSLVATVGVVQAVVLSVAKPPMSKIADVLGRFEAFTLCVIIFVLGYIQQATSNNVQTYAAAQIFYSAGSTGLQVLIQIFVADTSDLLNRALCSTLPQVPFLFNVWIGPFVADNILKNLNWRWGYGIWIAVLPVAFLPLALALITNQRKAARRGLLPKSQFEGKTAREIALTIWYELDVFGLFLLCGAFSLILIPMTLVAKAGWNNNGLLAMLIIGLACLIAFPFWERSKTLAPRAFFPRKLLGQRNVVVGMALAFFYFMAFYLSIYPYFQSYLLVVHDLSVSAAGHMVQTFTFSATITALVVSFMIKHTKHYKYFLVLGSIIYVAGLGLMLGYRTEQATIPTILFTQIVVGIGGGLVNVAAQLGVQACASHQEVGSATAVFLTLLEIGGAVGNAISGAIWTNSVPKKLALYLPEETKNQTEAIFGSVTLASTGWPVGSPTRSAINQAYQETMTTILTVAVCVAAPCIILSLLMKNYRLDEMDQHVKGLVIGGDQKATDRRDSAPLATTSRRSSVSSADDELIPDPAQHEQTRSLLGNSRKRS